MEGRLNESWRWRADTPTLEQSGVEVVDSQTSSFERWIFGTYFVVQPKLRETVSVLAQRKMASLWR